MTLHPSAPLQKRRETREEILSEIDVDNMYYFACEHCSMSEAQIEKAHTIHLNTQAQREKRTSQRKEVLKASFR